ncbi:MAG: hypothetical protein ACI8RD_000184 [Bacillariaceae sp.]|jgi:hypothetical protein
MDSSGSHSKRLRNGGRNRFGMAHRLGNDIDEETVFVGSTTTLVTICFLLSVGFCTGFFQIINANPQCMGMSTAYEKGVSSWAFGIPDQ